MATITSMVGNQPAQIAGVVGAAWRKLDFSVNPVKSGDLVNVFSIPAGSIVTKLATIVKTVEGTTCTVTIGDADSATNYDASVDLNATTAAYTTPGTDTCANGKWYSAAGTISLTMNNDASAAVVIVMIQYVTSPEALA